LPEQPRSADVVKACKSQLTDLSEYQDTGSELAAHLDRDEELLLLLLLAEEDDVEELLDDEEEVPSRLSALSSRVSASSARSGLCIRSCTSRGALKVTALMSRSAVGKSD